MFEEFLTDIVSQGIADQFYKIFGRNIKCSVCGYVYDPAAEQHTHLLEGNHNDNDEQT